MADLGGFVGGALAGQQYSQSQALFGLTVQETQQKLQEGALTIQEKELTIKQAQRSLDQQDALMRLMKGMGAGGKQDPVEQARSMSDMMFQISAGEAQVGRFEDSAKHAEVGTKLLDNVATFQAKQDAHYQRLAKDVTDLFSGVHDEQSKQRALQLFPILHPEEAKDPDAQKFLQSIASKPWTKELGDAIINGTLDAVKRSEIVKNNASAADSYSKERVNDFNLSTVMPARARALDASAEAHIQAGAAHLAPKTTDVNDIVKMAQQDFPDGDPTALYVLSRDVAADALQREKVDHVPRAQAQDAAYAHALERNHYAGIPMKGRSRVGSSRDKPLPLPDMPKNLSPEDQKDWIRKNLRRNMYYATKSDKLPGGIGVWTGTGFAPPEALTAKEPAAVPEAGADE